jgi:serine/threonine protein kinase
MFLTQSLPGYEIIEVVHTGKNTIIYRAWSQKLNQYVILKFPQAEYPNLEQIARLKYEYNVIAGLSLQGVLKIHRLEIYQNIIALVYEDFHGQSLRHFLSIKKLSLISFLKIAVQLARALETLHNHQIIHKDIKPANIIINPTTEIVKLADFSIASRLSQETPQLNNYQYLEGTLTYISPEQTGRMNRSLDYRSDFYSLGVTFYEMLTGKLPFASNDPLELVYCHIAKQPPAIHELHPDIPIEVIQIVKKLMEKNAEDRYQTANGLLADLETCLSQVAINNKITGFTLGRLDVLSRLLIPQKLYGRETEINLLLTAFERVSDLEDSAHGSRESEMLLVSGYSGMGKSAIVHEINKPITSQRGYFVSGKFDQFKQNIPYAALIQAFGTLMQQLFTEPPAALELWGEKNIDSFRYKWTSNY